MDPVLSLIIPTHNRRPLLMRVLDALAADPARPEPIEILVLADGCADDTAAAVRARHDLPLCLLELPGLGPAAARNRGAAAAKAPLLVFLDDDVIPGPGFLAAHLAAHAEAVGEAGALVLGPYPSAPHASPDVFQLMLRDWWHRHFLAQAQPGHRMRYSDVLTGNLSLPATLWQRLGGLDPDFAQANEDFDLGMRALAARVELRLAPRAAGLHYEYLTKTPAAALRRARDEGRAAVAFARKHPEVLGDLKLHWMRPRGLALRHRALFAIGPVLDAGAEKLVRLLPGLQRRSLHRGYRWLYDYLNRYWYLRGASEALGNFSAWKELRAAPARDVTPLLVDLAGGLEAAEALIEAERPEQIDLRHGERRLALTYLDPGAEPWRGHHLRPFLMNHCARPWLEQRMQPGGPASGRSDIGPSDTGFSEAERNAASRGLRHVAPHLNAATAPFVWHEQYDQWRKLAELQDQAGQPSA